MKPTPDSSKSVTEVRTGLIWTILLAKKGQLVLRAHKARLALTELPAHKAPRAFRVPPVTTGLPEPLARLAHKVQLVLKAHKVRLVLTDSSALTELPAHKDPKAHKAPRDPRDSRGSLVTTELPAHKALRDPKARLV